jgi:hypothetical protein
MKLQITKKVKILYGALWIYRNVGNPNFKKLEESWTKSTVIGRYFYCLLLLLKKIMQLNPVKINEIDTSVLLYVNSNNTYRSLDFLRNRGVFFSQVSSVKHIENDKVEDVNLQYSYPILSLVQLPFAFLYYIYINPKFSLQYPDFFVENWGKLEWNLKFLEQQSKLKIVVFSNDHNVQNRLFLSACKIKKIHTVYIQHAAVSKYFPPLDFDTSFLYGKIDSEKYKSIGGVCENIVLTGIPSFDPYLKYRKIKNKINIVGVSFNILDNIKLIGKIADYLVNELGYQVIIRPHSRDNRSLNIIFDGISISDAKIENPYNYLKKIDMHIAGDSSIHLESSLLNVPSFYFKMNNGEVNDYYGFVQNGMIDKLSKANDLLNYIPKIEAGEYDKFYTRCKSYCESVNTEYEGRVGERIIEKLEECK